MTASRMPCSRPVVRTWLVAAGLVLPLASGACSDDGEVITECVGALEITVPLAQTPAKLRVELRRPDRPGVVELRDECSGEGGVLLVERRAGQLFVNDGGFGYTPPARFDLKVTDLGTCEGTTTAIVDVSNVEVGVGLGVCDYAEVTLPAR
ncbi:MAG: hypothetical protein H7138_26735 [Myxococcales bacterium]|nr:hypothetical protein [Myxococcales bacterium]